MEIVIVVDHNGALYEHLKLTLPGVTVLANLFAQGVSGNRNTGVLHTKTPLVALLDDDVSAHMTAGSTGCWSRLPTRR